MNKKHIYSYTHQHLLRDGKPWLPAMGEFHYSRYPEQYWRDSIRLMKSGGIDIVSAYVIWIHHEFQPGEFYFSGNRDIRRFLQICDEEDMAVALRIGPWIHGEVRNGGFPDWLLSVPGCRSSHPAYMECVRRYWEALYAQIRDHIDGCIALIQFENEYVADGDDKGDTHINDLVRLAGEIGIHAPIHTATKCRGHFTGNCLPVFGSYPDAPWDGRLSKLLPNACYLFSRIRDSGVFGQYDSTLSPEELSAQWSDPVNTPYLNAEIGGGVQPTMHRRPLIAPEDVGALVNVKLGSGSVLPGIYMYHGGTNPGYALHESGAHGVPELNYDFQASIGEYGKPSAVYCELRRIFTFLRDFGGQLAGMPTVIPADNPDLAEDLEHLRYCIRTDGKGGFVFVNNHVRGYEMAEHTRSFHIPAGDHEVIFPEMTFRNGDYGFYPFRMPLGKGTLLSTNAQPLCLLNQKTYVFFTDRTPEYRTEGDISGIELLTLTEDESRMASKVTIDGMDYLLLCDAPFMQDGNDLIFLCCKDTVLKVYPSPDGSDGFAEYILTCPRETVGVTAELLSENMLMKEFSLKLSALPDDAEDMILTLDYSGNIAELFAGSRKIADQFSLGNGWQIGLKRFGKETEYTLRVFALAENVPVYMDKKPEFHNGYACALHTAEAVPEYAVRFTELHESKD